MQLSRVHIAFLAIMSLFTGIIGPGTKSGDMLVSYAMTDMRVWIFFLLILLVIGFYTAAVRNFRILGGITIGIIFILSVLFSATLLGNIRDIKSETIVSGFSWGWVFYGVGIILLIWSILRRKSDTESVIGSYLDMTIGVIGSITLTILSSMIFLTSISFHEKSNKESILLSLFGSGEVETLSWWNLWWNFSSEPVLTYDRKDTTLIIQTSGSQSTISISQDGNTHTENWVWKKIHKIGESLYREDTSGNIYSGNTLLTGAILTQWEKGILLAGEHPTLKTIKKEYPLPYFSGWVMYTNTGESHIIASKNGEHLIQVVTSQSGISIIQDGVPWERLYNDIFSIQLSSDGKSYMILASQSGSSEKILYKNDVIQKRLSSQYIPGTYRSNGNHYFYTERGTTGIKAYYDSEKIGYSLDEVREIFLDTDGPSYAFFGKVMGNPTYCLFTRYRWNLCGLEAYMNPILWADGTSIIYAGKKNGIWNIYRNSEVLIENVGYDNTNIRNDYVFFDTTNPRTYLFIRKDPDTQKYQGIKNGKILPESWDDIGVDQVYFGFDNHILLPVKTGSTWKILEI